VPHGSRTLVRLADSLVNLKGGNVAAGHGFAREACNSCHLVEMIGPAFQDIANARGMPGGASVVSRTRWTTC
jgi:cytochrome c551/c552